MSLCPLQSLGKRRMAAGLPLSCQGKAEICTHAAAYQLHAGTSLQICTEAGEWVWSAARNCV